MVPNAQQPGQAPRASINAGMLLQIKCHSAVASMKNISRAHNAQELQVNDLTHRRSSFTRPTSKLCLPSGMGKARACILQHIRVTAAHFGCKLAMAMAGWD